MICSKCQFENPEEAKFCINCGALLTLPSKRPLFQTLKTNKKFLLTILGILLVGISLITFYLFSRTQGWRAGITPIAPTPPPVKKERFVFWADRDLWLADTTGKIQKLTDCGCVENYSLSSQKDRIVYLKDDNEGLPLNLIIINIENGQEQILQEKLLPEKFISPTGPEAFGDPRFELERAVSFKEAAWSLDEQKIAFISGHDGQGDLYIINPNGTNLKRVTNDKLLEFGPIWSPDGNKIVFQTTTGFGTGAGFSSSLWMADLVKGSTKLLIRDGKLTSSRYFAPADNVTWISDESIVFEAFTTLGLNGIWKRYGTSGDYQCLSGEGFIDNVAFSGKTNEFAYSKVEESRLEKENKTILESKGIYITNMEGKTTKIVDGVIDYIKWSKDGQTLVYVTEYPSGEEIFHDLYLINKDGSNKRQVVIAGTFRYRPLILTPNRLLFLEGSAAEINRLWHVNPDKPDQKRKLLEMEKDHYLLNSSLSPTENYFVYSERLHGKDVGLLYLLNLEKGIKIKIGEFKEVFDIIWLD